MNFIVKYKDLIKKLVLVLSSLLISLYFIGEVRDELRRVGEKDKLLPK